jgi:manganese/zinc/iron transport system permease protein
MSNPYTDCDFFSFFWVLLKRLCLCISGHTLSLAQDELQVLTLSLVAIGASLVGVFLVLRKMTLLANALTHTTLFGIVTSYLFQSFFFGVVSFKLSIPMLVFSALLSSLLTTLTTEGLHRLFKLQEDASVGLVFSFYFALGVTLLSLFSRNTHLGTELITGNADVVDVQDVWLSLGVFCLNAFVLFVLYRGLKASTFDPLSAELSGYSPTFLNFILMLLTSLTCVSALRAVGALPLLVFITMPSLCARLWTHSLKTLLLLSMVAGSVCSLLGVALSRHFFTTLGYGLSTSGLITACFSLLYVGSVASLALHQHVTLTYRERFNKILAHVFPGAT